MMAIREEMLASGHQCSIIATSRSTRAEPEPDVYRPSGAFELLKLIAALKYDVLHIHVGGGIPPRVAALMFCCTLFASGRSVLTLHSGGYPLSEEGQGARKNSIRGSIFRRFTRIIAVNKMMAEMFVRFGVAKDRVRIILPFSHELPDKSAAFPEIIRDFAKTHTPFLLSTSLLEKEYDISLQIKALGPVLVEFPRAGLLIAGSGSLEEKLREEIQNTGYADHILMTGDLDHKTALNLIDDCDILLRTTHFDGDAISIREALFLETPVIATDNGMRPEGVHLIPVGDAGALAEKIKIVASGEKRVKKERAEDRSNLQAVVKLYEEIIDERH
jgi:glycosyltransferase involved in cell wall biosynthesis